MEEPQAVLVRFALYSLLGLLFGLMVARRLVFNVGEDRQGTNRLAVLAACAILCSAVGLADLAARMHGLPLARVGTAEVAMILSLPGLGAAIVVRFLALGAAFVLLCLGRERLAVAGAGVALVTLAWQGHAAAGEGQLGFAHLLATMAHLLAAAIWLGALAAFSKASAQAVNVPGGRPALGAALNRFHWLGGLVVAVLVLSGGTAFMAIVGWPLPASAFGSSWWWLLALKLLFVLAMLAMAAANRFWLVPGLSSGHHRAWHRVRTSLALELSLAFVILALVAWLGLLAPDQG